MLIEYTGTMEFLEELEQLRYKSPRPALHNKFCENSEYGNFCIYNKNSYMIFATDYCEDCFYCRWLIKGKDNVDCTNSYELELCYECLSSRNCYNSNYLQDCENCTDCSYSFNCQGCENCFGCAGLRHKKFHIFNKPYSEDEYKIKVGEFLNKTTDELHDVLKEYREAKEKLPRAFGHFKNTENSTGDYIYNSKDCYRCFEIEDCENSAYLNESFNDFNCYDVSFSGKCVDCFECTVAYEQNNCSFCWYCFGSSNLEYSEYCINCKDCFGCIGLGQKQYFILNKSYSKEDYYKEVTRIKSELKKTGIYNEKFLPSTYPLQDTLAAD